MKTLLLVSVVQAVIGLLAVSSLGQNVPKVIDGGVLNLKAISLPKPEYPELATSLGIGGTVKVEVTINENGFVESAKAVNFAATDDELSTERADAKAAVREAAERAALEAKFSPTLLSGVPIKVKGIIVYNFKSGGDDGEQTTQNGTGVGTLNGRAIELPDPEYPDAAKAVRAAGIVKIQVTIDEIGNVIAAKALSGHPLLQSAAVAAAQKARFEPAKEPVKIVGVITYNFILPEKQR